MKKPNKIFRTKSSGQLLIVAALAIAILVASTTVYVYELAGEKQNTEDYSLSEFVLALKLGSKNAVISALANVSNGGEKTVLANNLETLSSASKSFCKHGLWRLSYMLLNSSGYEDGIRLSCNVTANYAINITTVLTLYGYYTGDGVEKTVNLMCQVFNDGKPAQIENITLYYEDFGVWFPVGESNNLSITNYGNCTYAISFTAAISSDTVQVSAHVHDLRNVFVMANVTCPKA